MPAHDPIADFVRRVLPAKLAYPIARWKNALLTTGFYNLSRRAPGFVKKLIRRGVQRHLPEGYDVDTHFKPRYDPWDQRICLVPDGDLFHALRKGKASIVTDRIETFTERGLRLESGAELEADVIVTATGLNVLMLGGMQIAVDGREVELPETVSYKGMMFGGVPNMAYALGYTNASWTLKCDLVARIRVPVAEPHGRARPAPVHPARAGRGIRHAAVDRPQVGLRAALHRQRSEAGPARTVALAPELHARRADAAPRRAAGRGDGVLERGVAGLGSGTHRCLVVL